MRNIFAYVLCLYAAWLWLDILSPQPAVWTPRIVCYEPGSKLALEIGLQRRGASPSRRMKSKIARHVRDEAYRARVRGDISCPEIRNPHTGNDDD